MSKAKTQSVAVLKKDSGSERVGFKGETVASALDRRQMQVADVGTLDTSKLPDGQVITETGTGKIYQYDSVNGLEQTGFVLVKTGPLSYGIELDNNEVDPNAGQCILITGGSQPSKIGVQDAQPISGLYPWPGPSDYSQNATGAGLSTIVGGYDNINNGYASHIFGGLHTMIDANQTGHCVIVGGASNYIGPDAGRSGIFSSQLSGIDALDNNLILGGLDVHIEGTSRNLNTIINGTDNKVQGGRRATIINGQENRINKPASVTAADDSSIIGGIRNIVAAPRSAVIGGKGNEIDHGDSAATGASVKTIGSGVYEGCDAIDEIGDAQTFRVTARCVTTTGAVFAEYPGVSGGLAGTIVLPENSVIGGRVRLIGMRDGSATGANDGDFSQVFYESAITAYRGTDGVYIATEGDEQGLNAAADADISLGKLTQTKHTFAVGQQRLFIEENGVLRLLVAPANDSARVKWVAHFNLTMTRITP